MKRRHLAVYYGTLLIPVGALAGAWLGNAVGLPGPLIVLGVALACLGAHRLARSTAPGESP